MTIDEKDRVCFDCKVNKYCGKILDCEETKEIYNNAIDDVFSVLKDLVESEYNCKHCKLLVGDLREFLQSKKGGA